MMRAIELRDKIFLARHEEDGLLGFCGCGEPAKALTFLKEVLQAYAIEDFDRRWDAVRWILDFDVEDGSAPGIAWTYLYWLSSIELIEHGSSLPGAWLTEEGENLLAALEHYGTDDAAIKQLHEQARKDFQEDLAAGKYDEKAKG